MAPENQDPVASTALAASDSPHVSKPPLDELMLAMDIVDTLRHRERVLESALAAETKDQQLVDRLQDIYAGQGIEVSKAVLEQGVRALREDRFTYESPPPGFAVTLASIYATRGSWGKVLGAVVGIGVAVLLGYQLLIAGPQRAAAQAIPGELDAAYAAVLDATDDRQVETDALALHTDGESALARNDLAAARTAIGELDAVHDQLVLTYELRVVSRPGELSGVWRVPDQNPNAQNYYLIVEAIAPDGRALTLPIRNEENGQIRNVARWGQRVDERTFRAVADDKQDDGIIQAAVIGRKARGKLDPVYEPGVLSGTITSW